MADANPVSANLTLRRLAGAGTALTLLFLLIPALDLWAARLFFVPGEEFPLGRVALIAFIHNKGVPALLIAGIAAALVVTLVNLARGSNWLGLRRRGLVFVLLCAALGPGLLVNVVLKDHWGRARPAQIEAFGGNRAYTPPVIPSDECERNCSFVAGDPSAGFFYLSFAMLAGSAAGALAATALGLGLGILRMAEGGHFLSDVLFSGLLMAALIRFLYLVVVEPDGLARVAEWWRWARSTVAGRLTLTLILLAVAIVLAVRAIDRPVAEWAHTLSPGIRAVMQRITQLGVSTGWLMLSGVPVILFWLSRRRLAPDLRARWQSYAYLPLFVFVSVAGAGIANSLVKSAAGRFRPKLYFLDQRFGFDLWHRAADYTSFPSGHTVTVCALAAALALIWRPLAWPGAALALLVGLSRIMVGAHWPSDVLAAAWLGIAWTLWMRHIFAAHGVTMAAARAGQAAWHGPLFRLPPRRQDRKAAPAPCATAER